MVVVDTPRESKTNPDRAQHRAVRAVGATGRRKRQIPWVVAGVLLVAGSALGFALWAEAQTARTPVLVATTDLRPGDEVRATDFRSLPMAIGAGVSFFGASELDQLVGQAAQVAIAEGSIVPRSAIGQSFGVPAGKAIVGALLVAGEYPTTMLESGDSLRLFSTGGGTANDEDETVLGNGQVWSVDPLDLGGEPRVFISLLVDEQDAGPVSNAAAKRRLRLAEVAGDTP